MLGKVFVSLAIVASLVIFSSEKSATAETPCAACMNDRCPLAIMVCTANDCGSILSCLSACKKALGSDDYHTTVCTNQCSVGRTEASIQSAADMITCASEKCGKVCR